MDHIHSETGPSKVVTNASDLSNIDQTAREQIARKVGRILSSSNKVADQKAALELARVLTEDAAVAVRQALSAELKQCSFLPEDIIQTIANDIEDVALPFLVAAEAVDDEFLEEIVRSCNSHKQLAVAERRGLSEAVSFALADVGSQDSVEKLAGNDTADLSTRSYNRVMDRFPAEAGLMELLAARADLPSGVVERLLFKVSQRFSELLVSRFGLANDYAQYLTSLAKRSVFSQLLNIAPLHDILNYFSQLNSSGGLGSNELLIYLQNNNVRLFTAGVATLLDRPYEQVEAVVDKRDKKLLARLLDGAGFSRSVIGVLLISYERLK